MEWMELDEWHLDSDGTGIVTLEVDEFWKPKRSSKVLRRYREYTPVPEAERCHPRYPLVLASNFGELKDSLRKAPDIQTVFMVGDGFDWDRAGYLVRNRIRELETEGRIWPAVKDHESVPGEARDYVASIYDFPDEDPCQVICVDDRYYVRIK